MSNSTTHPGLFFTIRNDCSTAVKGFAVGDKLCLLSIGSATFMRAIFQGNMEPGETRMGMACAGDDGNGVVLFVPPVGVPAQAVQFTAKPNETLSIPDSFCGASGGVHEEQFKTA